MNTQEARGKFQEWQQRATDTARKAGQATDQYVRENAWTTLAMAALLGCVVGYLLASSRED